MDNNSLRKSSAPKSITHIENEHFALWLSSHEPELRFSAIQHSVCTSQFFIFRLGL